MTGRNRAKPNAVNRRPTALYKEPSDALEEEVGMDAPLRPSRLTTASLPRADQFVAWRDLMAPQADFWLPKDAQVKEGFLVDQTTYALDGLVVTSQKSDAFRAELPSGKLRSYSPDPWVFVSHSTGRGWVERDGRRMDESPATFGLRSLGRPFRGGKERSEALLLYLDRDALPQLASKLDAWDNTRLAGSLSLILRDYLGSLARRLPQLRESDRAQISSVTKLMIEGCLGPSIEALSGSEGTFAATMRERIRSYVRENLQSRDLSVDNICAAMGVSRSGVYRLFRSSGGVAGAIRRQRLIAVHAILADPGNRKKVVQLAEEYGFSSVSEFGRAFRREFGYSPRDARDLSLLRNTGIQDSPKA